MIRFYKEQQKSFEGDHRSPFVGKRQIVCDLRRQIGTYFATVLAACLVQIRSGSSGCKLAKAETTQCYGPIWMSELCSMCGKMATVQRLESFIFR